MPISWSSEFDSTQIAWLLFATVMILTTLLPSGGVLLSQGRCLKNSTLSGEQWFVGILLHAGLWILLLQSLAFSPSWGMTPESSDESMPPQSMESMIVEAAQTADMRHLHGRGGAIGDLSLAGFRNLETQGNPDEPLFATRRPYHSIPLSSFLIFHMALYLAAIVSVICVLTELKWTVSRTITFSVLWGGLVYVPVIHWLWGDGWLLFRGAIDTGGACFLIVLTVSVTILTQWRRGSEAEGSGETAINPAHSEFLFSMSAAVFLLGMLALMTTVTVSSFSLKALTICNAIVAAISGALVSFVLRAVQPEGKTTVSTVQYSVFGMCSVAAGVMLFDATTSLLVGGIGAVTVFSIETLLLKRFCVETSRVPRGIVFAATAGMLFVGLLGASTNGVHHWDGRPILSFLHAGTELLQGQSLAAGSFVLYPAIMTLGLKLLLNRKASGHTA